MITVKIDPKDALIDAPINVIIEGALPNSKVHIKASVDDALGQYWESEGDFQADENGTVDLSTQAPVNGTWDVIDPEAIIWSMMPRRQDIFVTKLVPDMIEPMVLTVRAANGKSRFGVSRATRNWMAPGVRSVELRGENHAGMLFLPPGPGPHPGLVMLHGAMGGMLSHRTKAALLASRGVAAMSTAYIKEPGFPKMVNEVPLEIILESIEALGNHPDVDSDRLALFGICKGSEASLITSALGEPNLKAVVVIDPTEYVWQGASNENFLANSSWKFKGEALPFVEIKRKVLWPDSIKESILLKTHLEALAPDRDGLHTLAAHEAGLKNEARVKSATIPVERIQAPILMLAAKDDPTWPCVKMGQDILTKRRAAGFKDDKLVILEHAGHVLNNPLLPCTIHRVAKPGKIGLEWGGNTEGRAQGRRLLWSETLEFLNRYVGPIETAPIPGRTPAHK